MVGALFSWAQHPPFESESEKSFIDSLDIQNAFAGSFEQREEANTISLFMQPVEARVDGVTFDVAQDPTKSQYSNLVLDKRVSRSDCGPWVDNRRF